MWIVNLLRNWWRGFDKCYCGHWRRYHMNGACGNGTQFLNACAWTDEFVGHFPLEAIHEFGEQPVSKLRPKFFEIV